jgi:glutamate/tyrosine decarboxylase-like PLP-dependent enzyme
MSLKFFGVDAFRQVIDRCIDYAAQAEQTLRDSGQFEILSPATLGIVCFRRVTHHDGERVHDEARLEHINMKLVTDLAESGLALISSTRVDGKYALRFCILNHCTSWDDVLRTIRWFESASQGPLEHPGKDAAPASAAHVQP